MIKSIAKMASRNKYIFHHLKRVYINASLIAQQLEYSLRGVRYFYPRGSKSQFARSQFGQDTILEDLGLLRRGGFFVEVGANDPLEGSNSYYLEKEWLYRGISIDPIDFSSKFMTERPNTEFLNCAVDPNRKEVDFFQVVPSDEGWEHKMSSLYEEAMDRSKGFTAVKRSVQAKTLKEICGDLDHVDILLLDVEGHEIGVLDSWEWERLRPDVVLIENTGQLTSKRSIESYMNKRRYKLIARIGRADDIYQVQRK